MFLKHFFFIILSLLFVVHNTDATAYTVNAVPNPKTYHTDAFVANPDLILSEKAVNRINNQLKILEDLTGVELAIVALNTIENDDENTFAYELFNHWRIGNKKNNTGILILFVKDLRAVKIETGVGIEGLLPDSKCNNILHNDIFPPFKDGDYETGLLNAIQTIQNTLTTEEAKEELLLQQNSTRVHITNFLSYYFIVGFVILIIFCWIIFFQTKRESKRNEDFLKLKNLQLISTSITIFFPLHLITITLWLKKRKKTIRYSPCICSKCNIAMNLLSQDKEVAFLNEYQTAEEAIKSIDYDVWLCPKCYHYDIFPYNNVFSHFTICPTCGSKAYYQKEEKTLVYPTPVATGTGVRIFFCEACKKKHSKVFIIPKINNGGGLVIAAGSRGIGSSGGSWGGGFSGGGGAGGRF